MVRKLWCSPTVSAVNNGGMEEWCQVGTAGTMICTMKLFRGLKRDCMAMAKSRERTWTYRILSSFVYPNKSSHQGNEYLSSVDNHV